MRKRACRVLAAAFLSMFFSAGALTVSPVQAADVSGCAGKVSTYNAEGNLVDRATGPGPGATEDNPLMVDPDGRIDWRGGTDAVITDATWTVNTVGFSRSGEFENADQKQSSSGSVALGEENPLASMGLQVLLSGKSVYRVEGELSGDGGVCKGTGYITGLGNPLFSPMWVTALLLLVLGIFLWLTALFGATTSEEVAAATAQAIDDGALTDVMHTKPSKEDG